MRGSTTTVEIDSLFDADGERALLALARRADRYRTYASHEKIDLDVGRGLPQRWDSVANFLRTGGRQGRTDLDPAALAARTGYLREEYAYDGRPLTAGIEPFLHHEALLDAARRVHGRPVVVPSIAYANVMLPGQELAVHTDVPEFRGLHRKKVPQWLLVVAHHSGLFDRWRLPIATGIAWFSEGPGGELSLWPDGPGGPCTIHAARAGTALVLDTDTVFHGVETVGGDDVPPPPISGEAELVRADDAGAKWTLRDAATGEERATYRWDDVRLSVSWKAYCFADEAERDAWASHSDDLDGDVLVDRLIDDLHGRDVVDADPPRDKALGQLLIDTYVRYPA